jgi:hypothetical protein
MEYIRKEKFKSISFCRSIDQSTGREGNNNEKRKEKKKKKFSNTIGYPLQSRKEGDY